MNALPDLKEYYNNNSIQPLDNLKVSEEIYWEDYYQYPDRNFEWKNGYLEEKIAGCYKNISLAAWLDFIIKCFLQTYPIAKVVQLGFAFRMVLSTGISIRKPDFAIVLNNNPIILNDEDISYKGIFDLCIESLSDSTKEGIIIDTIDKKNEYCNSGVKEYYIIDGTGKEMAFYRLNNKGKYDNIEPVCGDIIKSEVLPGFQFRISDFYKRTSIIEITNDEIYRDFMFPYYQVEKKRVERTEKNLELEKQELVRSFG